MLDTSNHSLQQTARYTLITGVGLIVLTLISLILFPHFAYTWIGFIPGLGLLAAAGMAYRKHNLQQLQARRQQLDQLLTQMKSGSRRERLLAIDKLRRTGLIKDGSMRGVDLSGLDLQGANLSGTNLQHANLTDTNLRGADLHWADLRHATLTDASLTGANLLWANLTGAEGVLDEQLATVYILRRAVLPSGQVYDGRYNLPGDLDDAGRDRIKSDDEEGLARWYEVSLEQYRAGQQWAAQHKDILQKRVPG